MEQPERLSFGGRLLAQRSELAKARQHMPELRKFSLILDRQSDHDVLSALLHLMFGYEADVQCVRSLGIGLDLIMTERPDIVFLDSVLPPKQAAAENMQIIRSSGYDGPFIVLDDAPSPARISQLQRDGAADILDRAELDSISLGQALQTAFAANKVAAE